MFSSFDRTEFGFDIKKAYKKLSQDPAKPLIYLGFFLILAFLVSAYFTPLNPAGLKDLSFFGEKKEKETQTSAYQAVSQSSINIINPTEAENWQVGTTQNIIWQPSNLEGGYIFILYRLKGAENWLVIKRYLSATTNSFDWPIPINLSGEAEVFVGISSDGKTWATYDIVEVNLIK